MKGRLSIRKEKAAARQALVGKGCLCASCPQAIPACCSWEVAVWPSEAADIIDGYPGVMREVRETLLEALKSDFCWRGADGPCPLQDAKTGRCKVYNDAPWTCVLFGWQKETWIKGGVECSGKAMPDPSYRLDDKVFLQEHYYTPAEIKGHRGLEAILSKSLPGVSDEGARVDYLPEGLVSELIRRGDPELKRERTKRIRRARERAAETKGEKT